MAVRGYQHRLFLLGARAGSPGPSGSRRRPSGIPSTAIDSPYPSWSNPSPLLGIAGSFALLSSCSGDHPVVGMPSGRPRSEWEAGLALGSRGAGGRSIRHPPRPARSRHREPPGRGPAVGRPLPCCSRHREPAVHLEPAPAHGQHSHHHLQRRTSPFAVDQQTAWGAPRALVFVLLLSWWPAWWPATQPAGSVTAVDPRRRAPGRPFSRGGAAVSLEEVSVTFGATGWCATSPSIWSGTR